MSQDFRRVARRVARRLDVRAVVAPTRAVALEIAARVDLVPSDEPPGLRTDGPDPHVVLREPVLGGFPHGVVELSWTLEVPRPVATDLELHVDTGHGFAEDTKTVLPRTYGGSERVVVELPEGLVGMRLDLPPDLGPADLRDVAVRRLAGEERQDAHVWTGPGDAYRWWVQDVEPQQPAPPRVVDVAEPPAFSVVMPVHDPPVGLLVDAVRSVQQQDWPHWQLCIADDASTDRAVGEELTRLAREDERIHVVTRTVNGNISAASNDALALATHPWVALLDHDDLLAADALSVMAAALAARPDVDIAYSDEDKVGLDGVRLDPYFKPDFGPELLEGQNVVSHLGIYRRPLVEQAGGFRSAFDGSQDYDLLLRVLELSSSDRVLHVPRVLYHWRLHPGSLAHGDEAKDYAHDAAVRALREHLDRTGVAADVVAVPGTRYRRVEPHAPTPTHRVLAAATAAQANAQVREAEVDVVVVTLPGVAPSGPADVETLVRCLLADGVVAAGPRVVRDDGRLEHAGLVLHPDGWPRRVLEGHPEQTHGPFGRAVLRQRVATVGGAIAVRRAAWLEAGGLDEAHPLGDVLLADLCLRLGDRGGVVLVDPAATFARQGEPPAAAGSTAEVLRRRWSDRLVQDPSWNPNLPRDPADGAVALPLRLSV